MYPVKHATKSFLSHLLFTSVKPYLFHAAYDDATTTNVSTTHAISATAAYATTVPATTTNVPTSTFFKLHSFIISRVYLHLILISFFDLH